MRHVGELFGRGEILLPFVLQSAEVMKRSVSYLEQFMDKSDETHGLKILLATVQGDVHDIGKNLVDIILSNNGYKVYNIGIKAPAETIIAKAREYDVDMIGLSGLLVKSAIVMQESMPQYKEAELNVPILLGGAALTPKFVAESCVPGYNKPVVYCADAFAGLKAVREFEEGNLKATTWEGDTKPRVAQTNVAAAEIDRTVPVPTPPFLGVRHIENIDPTLIFPYVNEQALFRGRWGYRRGKMGAEEYAELLENTVQPLYAELKRRGIEEGLLQPKVAYGYFRCFSRENTLHVEHEGKLYNFPFPRRTMAPLLCISDFFKTEEEGGDIASFFVVTIGEKMSEATRELFEGDEYHDYLMQHAFGVEYTDALAEYWHEVIRQEMGLNNAQPASLTGYVVQEYQGSRYGFGYPACPDLGAHIPLGNGARTNHFRHCGASPSGKIFLGLEKESRHAYWDNHGRCFWRWPGTSTESV
jgi:5-methyltetrahydrofolate--homocysteine methyltransferase